MDLLRPVMRHWASGVAIVTSRLGEQIHGLTANSLVSISIDPPRVAVTLANASLTYHLVSLSGIFAVTILADNQVELAERFAGKLFSGADRFEGVPSFTLETGAPLIPGGLAYLDCSVVHTYAMPASTLFVGAVLASQVSEDGMPLVYHQRAYQRMEK